MPTTKTRGSAEKARASRPRVMRTHVGRSMLEELTRDLARAPRSFVDAIRYVLRASKGDVEYAVLARSLSLTGHAIEHIPINILANAVAAPTDKELVLRILEAPQMAAPNTDAAILEAARTAGVEARDQLLNAQGGPWPVKQVERHLRLTRQAVDKRRKANKLIGLAVGRHGYLYPSWQFGRNGTLPGLQEVLHELRRHDPWSQVIFMLSPNDRLDGASPLDALRKGQIDDVRIAASLFGEHGAA